MNPKGIPGWLAGYNAAIADAGDLIEREAGARCGMSEMVRALCKPTCARCGGKRHVRTAPAKDGASFMMPCPDCSKPETPPIARHPDDWEHAECGTCGEEGPCQSDGVIWTCRDCLTPPNPEAAPNAYLRGYRNGIEATRSGAVDSATILHPEVAPAAQWGPMMGPPIAIVAAPVCATCEGVDCENSSGYCSLCNRPWRTKAT